MKPFLSFLAALVVVASVRADEPFLKPNDVIALVGGEEMVAMGEGGFLETHLHGRFPDYHLKIRSLAWEGDTVFEQPRMLNYPPLEKQLDEIGATVVIMQFGLMESTAGAGGVIPFTRAYEALIKRLSGASKRRIAVVEPRVVPIPGYSQALRDLAKQVPGAKTVMLSEMETGLTTHRDDMHLDLVGQMELARLVAVSLGGVNWAYDFNERHPLSKVIAKKNRLWDRYRRPQNWAFLAGDRITQASSRDHRDPSKRWFPEEMKEFIPLIEAKDREIWDLASKIESKKD